MNGGLNLDITSVGNQINDFFYNVKPKTFHEHSRITINTGMGGMDIFTETFEKLALGRKRFYLPNKIARIFNRPNIKTSILGKKYVLEKINLVE